MDKQTSTNSIKLHGNLKRFIHETKSESVRSKIGNFYSRRSEVCKNRKNTNDFEHNTYQPNKKCEFKDIKSGSKSKDQNAINLRPKSPAGYLKYPSYNLSERNSVSKNGNSSQIGYSSNLELKVHQELINNARNRQHSDGSNIQGYISTIQNDRQTEQSNDEYNLDTNMSPKYQISDFEMGNQEKLDTIKNYQSFHEQILPHSDSSQYIFPIDGSLDNFKSQQERNLTYRSESSAKNFLLNTENLPCAHLENNENQHFFTIQAKDKQFGSESMIQVNTYHKPDKAKLAKTDGLKAKKHSKHSVHYKDTTIDRSSTKNTTINNTISQRHSYNPQLQQNGSFSSLREIMNLTFKKVYKQNDQIYNNNNPNNDIKTVIPDFVNCINSPKGSTHNIFSNLNSGNKNDILAEAKSKIDYQFPHTQNARNSFITRQASKKKLSKSNSKSKLIGIDCFFSNYASGPISTGIKPGHKRQMTGGASGGEYNQQQSTQETFVNKRMFINMKTMMSSCNKDNLENNKSTITKRLNDAAKNNKSSLSHSKSKSKLNVSGIFPNNASRKISAQNGSLPSKPNGNEVSWNCYFRNSVRPTSTDKRKKVKILDKKEKRKDSTNTINGILSGLKQHGSNTIERKLTDNFYDTTNTNSNKNLEVLDCASPSCIDILNTGGVQEDYEFIGKTLGQGNFAVVRKAMHKVTKELVAVKTYNRLKVTDPEKFKSIRREIEILKSQSHPNQPRFFHQYENVRNIHIVMDFSGNQNQKQVQGKREDGVFGEPEAKYIFQQLLSAVHHQHRSNISHRDIKQENIVMSSGSKKVKQCPINTAGLKIHNTCRSSANNGFRKKREPKFHSQIKLVDFGFSVKGANELKELKLICGTLNYMAPELQAKNRYNGKKVDIWACGVVLFYMLTGAFPFGGKSERELNINSIGLNYRDEILPSEEAREIIEEIFIVDPNRRPLADKLLSHKWLSV